LVLGLVAVHIARKKLMDVDTSSSGQGTFTQTQVDQRRSRSAGLSPPWKTPGVARRHYNFMSNEIFVVFDTGTRDEPTRPRLFRETFITYEDVRRRLEKCSPLQRSARGLRRRRMLSVRTERVPSAQTKG
jgi:hypothetical protein